MSSRPEISIVVPVFNVAACLARCQGSLAGQTLQNIEIVYVDDGSTDASLNVLQGFAATDGRVKVLTGSNQGTLMARQKGVAASRGNWCLFVDPDDWLEQDACARMLMAAEGVDIVQCGTEIHASEDMPAADIADLKRFFNVQPGEIEGANLLALAFVVNTLPANVWGKLIRGDLCRASFEKQVRVYSVFAEDLYASFGLYAVARRLRVIADRLYHYSVSGGIMTRKTMAAEQFQRGLGALAMGVDLERRMPGEAASAYHDKLLGELLDMAVSRSLSPEELRDNLFAFLKAASSTALSRCLTARQRRCVADRAYIGEVEAELLHLRSSPFAGPKSWLKKVLHHD